MCCGQKKKSPGRAEQNVLIDPQQLSANRNVIYFPRNHFNIKKEDGNGTMCMCVCVRGEILVNKLPLTFLFFFLYLFICPTLNPSIFPDYFLFFFSLTTHHTSFPFHSYSIVPFFLCPVLHTFIPHPVLSLSILVLPSSFCPALSLPLCLTTPL